MRAWPLAPVLVAALSPFSAACQRDSGASGADAAASASAAAAKPDNPVDACIETLRAEAGSGDPASDGRMARGCADLYKAEICKDAHRRYDEAEPAKRAGTLSQRCSATYCERLPEPRPRLCGGEDVPAQQLGYLWLELRKAIWKLDLGEAEATRLEKEHLRLGAQRRRDK